MQFTMATKCKYQFVYQVNLWFIWLNITVIL